MLPPAAHARRHAILAICCLSLFLVSLDSSIVNVALPAMGRDIRADVADMQWIIDAYTLPLASLLILGGSLGDRYGRKPVFMAGLSLFALGSLLCSIAPTPSALIAARAFQALGGAMLNPVAMSIITNTFTDRRECAQAIGVWGAVNGLGAAAGPVLGGFLVTAAGWRSIFWINLPVAAVGLFLTWRFIPDSRAPQRRRFDAPGQLLMLAMLACGIGAIIEGPRAGWLSPLVAGLAGAALVSIALFIAWERRAAEPLIDLSLFRNRGLNAAVLSAIFAFASLSALLFLNTLYLQDTRGLSPLAAGLMTLPIALLTIPFSPLSGWLVARVGPRLPMMAAGLAYAVTALLQWLLWQDASSATLLGIYALFGIGTGLVNAPITHGAVSSLPGSQGGVAAGIASTSRQIGLALGVALAGSIIAVPDGGVAAATLVTRAQPMWFIALFMGVGICAMGWLAGGQPRTGEAGHGR